MIRARYDFFSSFCSRNTWCDANISIYHAKRLVNKFTKIKIDGFSMRKLTADFWYVSETKWNGEKSRESSTVIDLKSKGADCWTLLIQSVRQFILRIDSGIASPACCMCRFYLLAINHGFILHHRVCVYDVCVCTWCAHDIVIHSTLLL